MEISPAELIHLLAANKAVFKALLHDVPPPLITWKPGPGDWCLLEIVCHLYDEEREDFRARVKSTLNDPTQPWPTADPQTWVTSRRYLEQDYQEKLAGFLDERAKSIDWLRGLENPVWENEFHHEKVGPVTAQALLENWLAHDYLHVRQINRRKYGFLQSHCGDDLRYAGDW